MCYSAPVILLLAGTSTCPLPFMKVSLLNAADYRTTQWPGGSTTQLLILPENADYPSRNFKVRISTAVIQSFDSDFTSLPGVNRALTLLNGALLVSHQDVALKLLLPNDTIYFDGGWKTSSRGTGTDFNVMVTGDTNVSVSSLIFEKAGSISLSVTGSYCFIYTPGSEIRVRINQAEYTLIPGASLFVSGKLTNLCLEVVADTACSMVVAQIEENETV